MQFKSNNLVLNIDNEFLHYIPKVLQSRLINNQWETQEISMLQYIPADSTVLELGGCLGVFSGVLNRKLQNQNKHLVLEANPDLLTILNQVKADNNLKYTPLNAMIGGSAGKQIFYKHPSYALSGCSKKHAEFYVECEVEQYTLTDLEIKYNMRFDVMCMDIEGGEYKLYQDGFFSQRNMQNIKYLMIEMHNDNFAPSEVQGKRLAKTLHNHLSSQNMFTLKHKNGSTYLYKKI